MNHHFLQQLLNLQMLVPREVNQLSQVSRVPACGPKFSKRFSKRSKMEDYMKLHLLFASKRQVPRQMKQETIWNSSRIISSDSLMTELQKTIQATLDTRIFLLPSLINLPKPSCGPKFAESCQISALVPHWEMADQLVHPSDWGISLRFLSLQNLVPQLFHPMCLLKPHICKTISRQLKPKATSSAPGNFGRHTLERKLPMPSLISCNDNLCLTLFLARSGKTLFWINMLTLRNSSQVWIGATIMMMNQKILEEDI